MKHFKLAILLLCSAFLTHTLYADTNTAAAATVSSASDNNDQTVDISNDLKVVATQKHEENADLYYQIDVNYPQLTGKLSPAAQNFNQTVANMIAQSVQQFKNYVKLDQMHMQTLPEAERQNSLQIDYDLDVITPDHHPIISLRMNIEGMQAGRAHPYHTHQVLNYDLQTNKALSLGNLFKSRANYLNLIAKFCRTKLTSTIQDKWIIAEGAKPTEKNYKNWNIEADGILITFEEYQVAPYSYGAQEVEIPFSALKPLLAANSVMAPCLKDSYSCIAEA